MKVVFDPVLNRIRKDDYSSLNSEILNSISLLTNTAILDFGNTLAQQSSDLTITVTGAALNDYVIVAPAFGSVVSNSSYSAFVSATNTVTVRFNNYSSGAQDPPSGSFKVLVFHQN